MNRRSLLAALGASISLSGCSGLTRFNPLGGSSDPANVAEQASQSTATPTPTASPTATATDAPTETNSETPTAEPIATETPFQSPKLGFGTFATVGQLNYTVTEQEVSRTFFDTVDKNQRVSMPDGQRLMAVYITIENDSEMSLRPRDGWAVVLDGKQYTPKGSFSHPEYFAEVNVGWLRRSWGRSRITTYTEPLAPGDSEEYWLAFVIPADGVPTSILLKEVDNEQLAARWSLYA